MSVDLAAAARQPLTRAVLDAALKLVVVMAQSVMTGADGVSITLPRQGRLRTVAASNDVVLQMDHDQYDTGQGPCLDAATRGERFHSSSLEAERRWPQFLPRARARGIESIMSTALMAADRPLGALNVYSRAPETLASHEQQWAVQFAREASNVMLVTDATATADSLDTEISSAPARARDHRPRAGPPCWVGRRGAAPQAARGPTSVPPARLLGRIHDEPDRQRSRHPGRDGQEQLPHGVTDPQPAAPRAGIRRDHR